VAYQTETETGNWGPELGLTCSGQGVVGKEVMSKTVTLPRMKLSDRKKRSSHPNAGYKKKVFN